MFLGQTRELGAPKTQELWRQRPQGAGPSAGGAGGAASETEGETRADPLSSDGKGHAPPVLTQNTRVCSGPHV